MADPTKSLVDLLRKSKYEGNVSSDTVEWMYYDPAVASFLSAVTGAVSDNMLVSPSEAEDFQAGTEGERGELTDLLSAKRDELEFLNQEIVDLRLRRDKLNSTALMLSGESATRLSAVSIARNNGLEVANDKLSSSVAALHADLSDFEQIVNKVLELFQGQDGQETVSMLLAHCSLQMYAESEGRFLDVFKELLAVYEPKFDGDAKINEAARQEDGGRSQGFLIKGAGDLAIKGQSEVEHEANVQEFQRLKADIRQEVLDLAGEKARLNEVQAADCFSGRERIDKSEIEMEMAEVEVSIKEHWAKIESHATELAEARMSAVSEGDIEVNLKRKKRQISQSRQLLDLLIGQQARLVTLAHALLAEKDFCAFASNVVGSARQSLTAENEALDRRLEQRMQNPEGLEADTFRAVLRLLGFDSGLVDQVSEHEAVAEAEKISQESRQALQEVDAATQAIRVQTEGLSGAAVHFGQTLLKNTDGDGLPAIASKDERASVDRFVQDTNQLKDSTTQLKNDLRSKLARLQVGSEEERELVNYFAYYMNDRSKLKALMDQLQNKAVRKRGDAVS